jgi:drug/metabolite transporter (DMT)-like permease
MPWAAVALALVAAFCFALGSVAQQREVEHTDERGVRLFLSLARNPRWWAGWAGDTGGYVAQAGALAFGSLLVVQPLLVTALLFALPLSARWNRRRIERSELAWSTALIVAIGVFLLAGDPDSGVDVSPFEDWLPSIVVLVVVVAGALTVVATRTGRARGVALAVAAGCCYGLTSAMTKSFMHLLGDGLVPVLMGWETYVLAVAGASGFTMHQMAYQAGSLELSLPAVTILDPVVAAVLGVVALEETVRADGPEWVVIGLSVLVMVVGTTALARAGVPRPPTGTEAGTARPSRPRAG